MNDTTILARLARVKDLGRGNYRTECPAHGGHSLSVKVIDDGRVLLKCWAGCETQSVLNALGMSFSDLFPDRLGHDLPQQRRPWSARDVLDLAMREVTVLAVIGSDFLEKRTISETDWQRLATASGRLSQLVSEVRA